MTVNSKKMNGVPVRTVSGIPVGKLMSVDFDADTGRLAVLHVRLRGLGMETSQVAWSQVVSMSEGEIVVTDTSVSIGIPIAIRPNV